MSAPSFTLTTSSGGGDAQLKEILSSLKRKDATDATRQKYAIELRNYVRCSIFCSVVAFTLFSFFKREKKLKLFMSQKYAWKWKNFKVEKIARERSKDSFFNFLEEMNKEIHVMVNSRDANDRIAAIVSIDQLIDLNYDDQRKITRFSNYLRNVLTNQHGDATTVLMVTRALGRLAKASDSTTSKTLTAEWVDFETKRALEWLEGDNNSGGSGSGSSSHSRHNKDDGRRYAAVYVLKELAENAPTLFFAHAVDFLKYIWNGLDRKSVV